MRLGGFCLLFVRCKLGTAVKTVLNDHIKRDLSGFSGRQMVAYCCMKVVQKIHA